MAVSLGEQFSVASQFGIAHVPLQPSSIELPENLKINNGKMDKCPEIFSNTSLDHGLCHHSSRRMVNSCMNIPGAKGAVAGKLGHFPVELPHFPGKKEDSNVKKRQIHVKWSLLPGKDDDFNGKERHFHVKSWLFPGKEGHSNVQERPRHGKRPPDVREVRHPDGKESRNDIEMSWSYGKQA